MRSIRVGADQTDNCEALDGTHSLDPEGIVYARTRSIVSARVSGVRPEAEMTAGGHEDHPYETTHEAMNAMKTYANGVLQTDRLILRRFTPDDGDLLVELDGDPEVRRFLSRTATPRDEIEARILPALLAEYDRHPGFGQWATLDRTTGAFLGWFALRPARDNPRDASLGYRLRRSAWGRGYATEGARALIDRAFTDLGAHRVHAQTMAVNAASRRVMEKCGMRYVRTFHEHFDDPLPGTEHGEVVYEIHYEDWLARRT